MTRALVTGATGFIGWHLVNALLAEGVEVVGLRRPSSDISRLAGRGVKWVRGDVRVAESLRPAVERVDAVYHLTGLTASLGRRQFFRVNEQGTRNLLSACAARPNPPVVILVSSLAAAGPARAGRPLTEDSPSCPVSQYGKSKRAAELAAHEFADSVPVTIVRPPLVFGPWDECVLRIFRPIWRFGIHWNSGWFTRPLSLIHATDLANALLQAARRGRRLEHALPVPQDTTGRASGTLSSPNHEGYYLVAADEQPTYAEFGRRIASALGRRTVVLRTPPLATWGVAGVNELRARLSRRPHIFSWDKAREARAGAWTCSAERASQELGWRCDADLDTRLHETAEWYLQQGWLK
jgi:nucleoside-diphosphate-sugar epimerase